MTVKTYLAKAFRIVLGNMLVLALIVVVGNAAACGIFLAKDSHQAQAQSELGFEGSPSHSDLLEFRKEEVAAAKFSWKSYTYWRRVPFVGKFVNVDASGLRKTWSPGGTETPQIRVFFFGGSTVWGTGSRDDGTIPSYVSRFASAEFGARVRVFNFGETGYVTTQELIALLGELQRGNIPDVVVFLDGYNDTFSTFQNGVAGLPQNEMNRIREFGLLQSTPRFYLEWARSSSLSRLLTSVAGSIAHFSHPEAVSRSFEGRFGDVDEDLLASDTVDVYSRNIGALRGLCDAHGTLFLSFWQPSAYTKRSLSPAEQRTVDSDPAFARFNAKVVSKLRSSAVLNDTAFADLSGLFDGRKDQVFTDYVHATEDANRVIADSIARKLKPLIESLVSGTGRLGRK